jgi:hypothetical protein
MVSVFPDAGFSVFRRSTSAGAALLRGNAFRVRWMGAAAGGPRMQNLAFAATVGGTNLCTGGTPIASGGTPADAFNGAIWRITTLDASNVYYDSWVGYVLPTTSVVAEVRVTLVGMMSNDLLCMPRCAVLDRSRDGGSTWTPVSMLWHQSAWTGSEAASFVLVPQAFSNSLASAFGWRVLTNSIPAGSYVTAREIEFALTGGGADQCTGGFGFASTAYGSNDQFAGYKAFDDSTATEWTSETDFAVGGWVAYMRPTGFVAAEMRWTAGSVANERPTSLTVQWCSDTLNWNNYATYSGLTTGWTTNVARAFVLP